MRNVEIKARCSDPVPVRNILVANRAEFIGTDSQTDTYFNVAEGRLKLRQGSIENHLIRYRRADKSGPKLSGVTLYKPGNAEVLKSILADALGVKVVVDKVREIYFIDNVKFHIDRVEGLGGFVEIEVIDESESIGLEQMHLDCGYYIDLLNLNPDEFVKNSYSDLISDLKI